MPRGRAMPPREREAHLRFKEETCPRTERRKDQREGEMKRIYGKKKPVLFADKARAETLMNTGWTVLGRDRTSVSPCFQVLPSPFTGDHPSDPDLGPSQTIIQPESATSQQYSFAVHAGPRGGGGGGKEPKRNCRLCPPAPPLPLSLCLFWL